MYLLTWEDAEQITGSQSVLGNIEICSSGVIFGGALVGGFILLAEDKEALPAPVIGATVPGITAVCIGDGYIETDLNV